MISDNASSDGSPLLGQAGTATPPSIGKYRVDGIIGRGAVGIVYRGYDTVISRPVAIKTLRHEVLETVDDKNGLLARFSSEARSAGRCQHPNIVTVFDYVEQDDTPFIVMEYVAAGTLEAVTRTGTLLPLHQVGEILVQLLSALGHAHEKGVVHRDIKPANILCPAATSIKVTDFGVARLQDLGLTQAGKGTLGTPNYMSPELFLGREVDGRSDLFAAGVVLFELLAGAKPFTANDMPELMRKLLNQPPQSLGSFRPELSGHLDAVLVRALARNPTDRFQTADEFSEALVDAVGRTEADKNVKPVDLSRIPRRATSDQSDSRGMLNRTMAEKLMPGTIGNLERSLARSLGPIARLAISRASSETTDADMFLTRLTSLIPESAEAKRFRETAENWLREDQGIAGAQLDAVIPTQVVKETIELLRPMIGPMAKVIAEREAKTAVGVEDYYEHVARAIKNPQDQEKFLAQTSSRSSPGKRT